MSTRCNIIVKEGRNKVTLYHHHDGYPEGVGSILKQYLGKLYNWYHDDIANELIKGITVTCDDGTTYEDNEFEWSSGLHGDIEYIYIVDCKKKTLVCYARPGYDVPVTKKFETEWNLSNEIPD